MAYRIGVLGGMGPLATQYFLDIFFERFVREMKPKNDQDFPDMTILMECSTPDRTTSIKNGDNQAALRINGDLARLIKDGCESIVVPCITGHSMIEDRFFERAVIDLRRAAINEFSNHRGKKVGIMATDGSIMTNVFKPLEDHFELVYPDAELQKEVMKVIYDSKGDDLSPKKSLGIFERIKRKMKNKGAELYLAGCTEIEMFAGKHRLMDRMIMPMNCLCSELLSKIKAQNSIVNSVQNFYYFGNWLFKRNKLIVCLAFTGLF